MPPNKIDESLFEDVPYQATPAVDDNLFEDVPHPDHAPVVKAKPKERNKFLAGAPSVAAGAAIGGVVGKLGQAGANVFDKYVLDGMGNLDRPQMNFITENPDVYKKASSWESLLNDFKSLAKDSSTTTDGATKHYGNYIRKGAQDLKDIGKNSAKIARESLEGSPSIRTENFYKALADQAQDPKYSVELPESAQNEFIAQSLDDSKPRRDVETSKISDIENNISQLNEELKNPTVDERSLINQEHRNSQFQNKLSQVDDRVSPNRDDQIVGAKDDLKFKTEARKLQRIEEKKAELEIKAQEKPSSSKALENIQKRREDFIYNQANKKEATDVTRGAEGSKELDVAERRKAQLTNKKIEDDLIAAKLKEADQNLKKEKINQKLSELEADKRASLERIEKVTLDAEKSGNKTYFKTLNTPEEIRAAANGTLDNKKMGQTYASALEKTVDRVRGSEVIAPQTMDQIIQEIRDGVNYGEKGSPAPELDKKLAREVRFGLMGPDTHPVYDKNMTVASSTMKAQDALAEAAQVKYNEAEQAILPKTSEDKLSKVLAQPDVYPDEFKQLNVALEQTGAHTQTPLPLVQERLAQSARLDNEFEKFGTKADSYGNVDISDSGKAKLQELVSNPGVNEDKIQRLKALLEESQTISSNPKAANGQTMLNNMTASGIKQVVNDSGISNMNKQRLISSGAKGLAGATVGGLTGGPAGGALGAVAGAGSDIFGTKLQELMARFKATGAYNNVAKPVIDNAGKIGGAAGALMAYSTTSHAADEGRISQDQKPLATLAEYIAPPLTSPTDSIAEGNKAYGESLSQGDGEGIASLKAVGGSLGGFVKPITDAAKNVVPVLDQAIEGGVKAIGNTLESVGTEQSNAARARMEKRMNISSSTPAPKKAVPHEDFRNFVEQRPEQIQELAQFFSNDEKTASFVAPLEKAAQADDRTRSAVLFGLYQQPAFRQAMKARTPSGNE